MRLGFPFSLPWWSSLSECSSPDYAVETRSPLVEARCRDSASLSGVSRRPLPVRLLERTPRGEHQEANTRDEQPAPERARAGKAPAGIRGWRPTSNAQNIAPERRTHHASARTCRHFRCAVRLTSRSALEP